MPWQVVGSRRYLYRSVKVLGKPRSVYVGCGPIAEAAYAQMQVAMEARRQARVEIKSAGDLADQAAADIDLLVKLQLLTAGYRQHQRGAWRRRRTTHGK